MLLRHARSQIAATENHLTRALELLSIMDSTHDSDQQEDDRDHVRKCVTQALESLGSANHSINVKMDGDEIVLKARKEQAHVTRNETPILFRVKVIRGLIQELNLLCGPECRLAKPVQRVIKIGHKLDKEVNELIKMVKAR